MKPTIPALAIAILVSISLSGQTPTTGRVDETGPEKSPLANIVPPDQQAYRAAWLMADPQQQIDALGKVAADYPSSRYAERARMGALRLWVKVLPSQRTEILRHIDRMLKGEKAADPGPYDDVATILVDAGVLLDKAQNLSERTVKAFR